MESASITPEAGLTLQQWYESRGIGKSTANTMLGIVKAMGVEVAGQTVAGSTKPVALLVGESLAAMDQLLDEHRNGTSIPKLKEKYSGKKTEAQQLFDDLAQEAEKKRLQQVGEDLLKRLQAADLAARTGMVLSREEMAWIAGAGSSSQRFKAIAEKKRANQYVLKPANHRLTGAED